MPAVPMILGMDAEGGDKIGGALSKAINALKQLIDFAKQAALEGDALHDAWAPFYGDMEKLREAAGREVKDLDLLKIAATGLRLGVHATNEQMATFISYGKRLEETTGRDMKGGLETLFRAISSGTATSLKPFIGDVELTGNKLSDMETIVNAVSEATTDLGEDFVTVGDKVARFDTRMDNLAGSFNLAFTESDALVGALDNVEAAMGDNTEIAAKLGDAFGLSLGIAVTMTTSFLREVAKLEDALMGVMNALAAISPVMHIWGDRRAGFVRTLEEQVSEIGRRRRERASERQSAAEERAWERRRRSGLSGSASDVEHWSGQNISGSASRGRYGSTIAADRAATGRGRGSGGSDAPIEMEFLSEEEINHLNKFGATAEEIQAETDRVEFYRGMLKEWDQIQAERVQTAYDRGGEFAEAANAQTMAIRDATAEQIEIEEAAADRENAILLGRMNMFRGYVGQLSAIGAKAADMAGADASAQHAITATTEAILAMVAWAKVATPGLGAIHIPEAIAHTAAFGFAIAGMANPSNAQAPTGGGGGGGGGSSRSFGSGTGGAVGGGGGGGGGGNTIYVSFQGQPFITRGDIDDAITEAVIRSGDNGRRLPPRIIQGSE